MHLCKEVEISHIALNVSSILGFNKRNRKHCDRLFEQLSEYGIIIDPMSDKEWANTLMILLVGISTHQLGQ